ncbi:hypothetical protein ACS0TY_008046 [Phlomoides rotata]
MGKRKARKDTQETPVLADDLGENDEEEEEGGGGKGAGFFACYLLTSLCPRFKGHTYIGYTLNPRRRIRQHNGEIGCGAWRTKRKRPWEMVLCIYGFPTNIAALQFEWAWQHPVESLAVRSAAASFKSLSGLANKIKLAYTMLTLPAWQRLNLTVNLFSTKYQKYTSACPTLPQQMRTQICSMDDLPCYNKNACVNDEWDDDNKFEEEPIAAREEEVHNSPPPSLNEENVHQEISHSLNDVGAGGSECLAGTQVRWPTNSPESPQYREENQWRQWHSFCTNDSPAAKTLFSFTSSSYVTELSGEFDEPLNNRSATALVADEDQALMKKSPDIRSREVEIIDLFTPSPCHAAVNSGRKKRRPTVYPEIIDLTNSPLYV